MDCGTFADDIDNFQKSTQHLRVLHIQEDLNRLVQWSEKWQMLFNQSSSVNVFTYNIIVWKKILGVTIMDKCRFESVGTMWNCMDNWTSGVFKLALFRFSWFIYIQFFLMQHVNVDHHAHGLIVTALFSYCINRTCQPG